MRVGLYNGIYFGNQFAEIDKFCCYKKKVLIYSPFIVASTSLPVLQYWRGSTEVLLWKYWSTFLKVLRFGGWFGKTWIKKY